MTQFAYDPLDRVVTTTDPLGGVTRFTYDPTRNLLTVTDAKGQTTTHTYDPMNRLETRSDPLTRVERFTYDLNGNLATATDRKNQTTTHSYDATNRRTRTEYADGASVSFTYDAAGNLLTATDSITGTLAYAYDAVNRRTAEQANHGTVLYTYDAASRRQTMQASGLQPVAYGFDGNSRLTGITQVTQTATLTYDPVNRRTALVLPNGITVTYTYDEASRLIAQSYTGPSGVLGDLTYQYDVTGNRIGTGGSFARTIVPSTVPSADYDASNAQLAFGPVTQTFDANGNLLTQSDASGTTTYGWDARNRLTGISGPTVSASFAYDAVGRRISKTINGVTTTFLYDGLDIIREGGGGGDASYLRTLSIDEALSRSDGGEAASYVADILGSTVALADTGGALSTTYTYAPFGETSLAGLPSASAVQYTGRENDGTGLYYYRARYYDPVRSRFVGEDPVGLAGGFNAYRYVRNAPLGSRDPSGLLTVVGGFGGSAIAGKGVEASVGGYYNWDSGEAGGFVSVGGGGGLNVSGDVFGGVVWGDLQGVTTNTNIVIGPISITLMVDLTSGQLIGGTVGVGPLIPGIPPYGLSQTISATGTLCLVNCVPPPTACAEHIK